MVADWVDSILGQTQNCALSYLDILLKSNEIYLVVWNGNNQKKI